MQCLFLFKDAAGRLPTAQDLRRCGFLVSEAALPGNTAAAACAAPDQPQACAGRALAAEPKAVYGGPAQGKAPEGAPDRTEEGAEEGAGIHARPPHARAGQEHLHGPPQPRHAR